MILILPIMLGCKALNFEYYAQKRIALRLLYYLYPRLHEQFITCSRQIKKDCFIRMR